LQFPIFNHIYSNYFFPADEMKWAEQDDEITAGKSLSAQSLQSMDRLDGFRRRIFLSDVLLGNESDE